MGDEAFRGLPAPCSANCLAQPSVLFGVLLVAVEPLDLPFGMIEDEFGAADNAAHHAICHARDRPIVVRHHFERTALRRIEHQAIGHD